MSGFCNSNGPIPGMATGLPDVCNTPMPPLGQPAPIPYDNMALTPTAIPTQFTTLLQCMPAHNIATVFPLSLGDTPGLMMGLVSFMVMGPVRYLTSSFSLFFGGPPATRTLETTGHNGMMPNDPGMVAGPSQTGVASFS